KIEILATDLSARAVGHARSAVWPLQRAREIPSRCLKAFMLRGTGNQAGKMKAGSEIRSVIRFERLNLIEEPYPELGRFDLIFCRNVMIYFRPETRRGVAKRLLGCLQPRGSLLLGHAETLEGLTDRARPVRPTIYTLVPDSDPADTQGHGPTRP